MKKLLCWLLALTMVLTAAGCKKQDPNGTTTEVPTTVVTEPEVLEVPYEEEMVSRPYEGVVLEFQTAVSASAPEAAAMAQAAEYFALTTGAQVNVYWKETIMDLNHMDIFEVTGSLLASDYLDYALDLTDMAQAAGYESWSHASIRQQVLDRCGYLAGIASVPHLTALYYDVDAFDSCGITATPSTWMDFLTLCTTLSQWGWVPLAMDAEFANLATELHLEHALGVDGLQALINSGWGYTEEAAFAAEQISYLVSAGFLAGGAPAVYPEGYLNLAGGNAAMMASSDLMCRMMEQDGLMEVTWGVFPWPGDGAGTGTAVDEQVLVINKKTENAQAAFDFVRLLTSGEFDQLRADLRRGIPADPNNESAIRGAVEALEKASSKNFGILDTAYNEIYARLWQGTYPTGRGFLGAMG